MPTHKLCSKCKSVLPVADFHQDKSRPDGLAHRCKICESLRQKHYYQCRKQYYRNTRSSDLEHYRFRNKRNARKFRTRQKLNSLTCYKCGTKHIYRDDDGNPHCLCGATFYIVDERLVIPQRKTDE